MSRTRAGVESNIDQGKDRPEAVEPTMSSTEERLMTLEQLEARIASLNASLLRDPALCQSHTAQGHQYQAQPTAWQKLTRPTQSDAVNSCCSSVSDSESCLDGVDGEELMPAGSSARLKVIIAHVLVTECWLTCFLQHVDSNTPHLTQCTCPALCQNHHRSARAIQM